MTIWTRLLTSLRAGANDMGMSVADGQALRILDQEIRDSDMALRESRQALAELMARHRLAVEQITATKSKVAEYEGYALKALESKDDRLALDVAGKIAVLESSHDGEALHVEQFATGIADLRKAIGQAEGHIRRLKQQVDTVKATESVQRAQTTIANRHAGSQTKLQTAVEALDRIKQKQAERGARMEAAEELAAEDTLDALDSRLRKAGIMPDNASPQAVLARLKQKAAG